MSRFNRMFAELEQKKQGAFIPFVVLLDPDRVTSKKIILALIEAGADALELGIAFSDPLADGPTIQKASMRALKNHISVRDALDLVAEIRAVAPNLPIGILTYANLVVRNSKKWFYGYCQASGVDAVLVADVPIIESEPFCQAAMSHEIDPVLIAPPNFPLERIGELARLGRGFTYVVTRTGVTGAKNELKLYHDELLKNLQESKAPPAVFGFGISTPAQVKAAIAGGAKGAICGSKLISIIEENIGDVPAMITRLKELIGQMKAATIAD